MNKSQSAFMIVSCNKFDITYVQMHIHILHKIWTKRGQKRTL